MNCLIIVSHGDDETLNMGGTLNHFKQSWRWKIVCITKDIAHGRDPQFYQMCKLFKAEGLILGFEQGLNIKWQYSTIAQALGPILRQRKWDRVFTHNKNGEYGHFQHKQAHEIVKDLCQWPLWTFGFNNSKIDLSVRLTAQDIKFKQKAAELYKAKTQAINNYPFFHTQIESFKREQ